MAENRNVTIYLINTTAGTLSLVDSGLSHGKWGSGYPVSQVPRSTNKVQIVYSSGTKDSAVGTEGFVKYQATDKTIFTIKWDVPYSASNSGTVTCEAGGNCAIYTYKWTDPASGFPASGNQITVTATIARSDLKISRDALISAVACDSEAADRIRKAFGSNEEVGLREILDAKGFDAVDKVTAALRAGFFSDSDLRGITEDFAARMSPKFSAAAASISGKDAASLGAAHVARSMQDSVGAAIYASSAALDVQGAEAAEWQLDIIRKYAK